jgi:diaminopimelate decarboxylase
MSGFYGSNGELVCDGVSLAAIADAVGTPVYVYSADTIRARYRAIHQAFGGYPSALHYALKANSTFALVQLLHALGSAADANSVWEIDVARRAGFRPADIVFTGVGKSGAELECAVPLGLKAINVESAGELARIEAIAARLGKPVRVAVRINPDIDANSHPHISTGLKINKFGVPLDAARELLGTVSGRPLLAGELARAGLPLEYVDVGGGLGISYDGGDVVSAAAYVQALVDAVRPTGLPIVIEPGRSIVGPAGALIARVIDVKPRNALSEFAVIDAGMTELMRPALYGAFHRIEPLHPREGAERQYEIVGPVCESSDVVGRDRFLPAMEVGDLIAIRDAGAYGSAMASNYNRRPLPAEVLVDAGAWRVIRRRQTIEDQLALED